MPSSLPGVARPDRRVGAPPEDRRMSFVDAYVGAFLGSLVVVGVLGWLLLWPSQR